MRKIARIRFLTLSSLLLLTLILAIIKSFSDASSDRSQDSTDATLGHYLQKSASDGIAVLHIDGLISATTEQNQLFQFNTAQLTLADIIYRIPQNKRIKAVVFRINSPGGTVGMTQEIYNAILYLRKKNIYTVASFADIAASGGYYVASACDAIFANPGTMTGSIGVIIQTANFKDLFKKLGVSYNTIKAGEFKDILSMARDMKASERQLLQIMVDETYRQFLTDVSKGRKMPMAKVSRLAEGKIYTGSQAQKNGLVDQLGGLREALLFAHKKAGLKGDEPNIIPLGGSPWDKLFESLEMQNNIFDRFFSLILGYVIPQKSSALFESANMDKPATLNVKNRTQILPQQKGNILHYENLIQYRFIP